MEAYPSTAVADNLLSPLTIPTAAWSITRRLAWTREENPRTTSGNGARRRSSYEHQLDEHLLLLRACDDPNATVRVGRHRCRARRRQFITPDEDTGCRCKTRTLRPWELLHGQLEGRALVIHAYRAKMLPMVQWCRDNHPRVGWGARQSKQRAARRAEATGFYLRAACWTLFYAWRRVVRALVELLRTLDRWWWSLLPVPRSTAPARNEQEPGSAPKARAPQRAQVSDEVQVTEPARGAPPTDPDEVWRRVRSKLPGSGAILTATQVREQLELLGARAIAIARGRES